MLSLILFSALALATPRGLPLIARPYACALHLSVDTGLAAADPATADQGLWGPVGIRDMEPFRRLGTGPVEELMTRARAQGYTIHVYDRAEETYRRYKPSGEILTWEMSPVISKYFSTYNLRGMYLRPRTDVVFGEQGSDAILPPDLDEPVILIESLERPEVFIHEFTHAELDRQGSWITRIRRLAPTPGTASYTHARTFTAFLAIRYLEELQINEWLLRKGPELDLDPQSLARVEAVYHRDIQLLLDLCIDHGIFMDSAARKDLIDRVKDALKPASWRAI